VFSVLGTSKYKISSGILTTAALISLSGQQILTGLKPVLSSDQVEKYENQVLEPALVLDGGSCVERTMFALAGQAKANIRSQPLSFHIQ